MAAAGSAQALRGADSAPAAAGPDSTQAEWHWSDQGGQIQLGINAVTFRDNLYVFTRGTDGHLWVNWWDGSWHWGDQGGQIQLGINAVTFRNNLYVFTQGTDGHLWVNWWG